MRALPILLLAMVCVPAAGLAQHSGHAPAPAAAAPPADPHAGHAVPPASPPTDPHAGHDMASPPAAPGAPPAAPAPPEAEAGPEHAADAVYGADAMAAARGALREEHGAIATSKILVDRLEARLTDGRDGYAWDAEAWHGGDIDKLWVKSEGEGSFGEAPAAVEVQALWSHAVDPWFDLQAGIRYDFRPDPERAHLVLGLHGLAPYWFEVDGALFLSDQGDLSARLEAEYDLRISQRLILQPRLELNLAARDDAEIGIGSGLSTGEAGLRLRYELAPQFAPYVGLAHERAFGDTAGYRRAAGEPVAGWSLLAGVRAWF
ncbi:MAG TPA: copper resistance protein B [Allosphingosinicella sp.]|nr:copper resistance protein B [Allosphingosinicella sp.]